MKAFEYLGRVRLYLEARNEDDEETQALLAETVRRYETMPEFKARQRELERINFDMDDDRDFNMGSWEY